MCMYVCMYVCIARRQPRSIWTCRGGWGVSPEKVVSWSAAGLWQSTQFSTAYRLIECGPHSFAWLSQDVANIHQVFTWYNGIMNYQYNTIQSVICKAPLYKLSRSANKNYENDSVNRNAFRCRLQTLVSVIVRRWDGSEFHAAGPE